MPIKNRYVLTMDQINHDPITQAPHVLQLLGNLPSNYPQKLRYYEVILHAIKQFDSQLLNKSTGYLSISTLIKRLKQSITMIDTINDTTNIINKLFLVKKIRVFHLNELSSYRELLNLKRKTLEDRLKNLQEQQKSYLVNFNATPDDSEVDSKEEPTPDDSSDELITKDSSVDEFEYEGDFIIVPKAAEKDSELMVASEPINEPEPSDHFVEFYLQKRPIVDRHDEVVFAAKAFQHLDFNTANKSTETIESALNFHVFKLSRMAIGPKEANDALLGLEQYRNYLLKHNPHQGVLRNINKAYRACLQIQQDTDLIRAHLVSANKNLTLYGQGAAARRQAIEAAHVPVTDMLEIKENHRLRDYSPIRRKRR